MFLFHRAATASDLRVQLGDTLTYGEAMQAGVVEPEPADDSAASTSEYQRGFPPALASVGVNRSPTGSGVGRSARVLWEHEVEGSSPSLPTSVRLMKQQ
jgi:hypothetical protein